MLSRKVSGYKGRINTLRHTLSYDQNYQRLNQGSSQKVEQL
ncbi:hypothetical protein L289_2898 [Acinetobacter gerneri DSM 14967 = CIP 107464 = MTCC 9824]|nr:hypothetical protein L289_2898 [Acinetobacter gerneri DSM 14967 = CIP 107464 = MTCC 9824]